jgi:hypothetical protein
MSFFSSIGDAFKKVGSVVGKVASVALPVAGFAVGLVAPALGAGISKVADKLGNKVSQITGIGDGKPGILGIGDGLPGILGIGTGKNKAENIAATAKAVVKAMETKEKSGEVLTAEEQAAKTQAEADIKKESGINPLYLLLGGLGALFVLKK